MSESGTVAAHLPLAPTLPATPWKLYAGLGLMVFCWSLNYVTAKVAVRELPPLFVTSLRTGLAGLMILPVYLWRGRSESRPALTLRDLGPLLLLGLGGVVVNQLFFVLGMSQTSVAHGAVMISQAPVLVLAFAAWRKHEQLSSRKVFGFAVAIGGVLVLQLAPRQSGQPTFRGDFFVFLATFIFAVSTVAGRSITARHGTLLVNTVAYVAGGLLLLPVTLMMGMGLPLANVSLAAWASIVFMALFPSVVCYLIYYDALTHLSASRVVGLQYFQPVLGTLLGAALLGEQLTAAVAVGGALALAGVMVSGRSQ